MRAKRGALRHYPNLLSAMYKKFTLVSLVAWMSLLLGMLEAMETSIKTVANFRSDEIEAVGSLEEKDTSWLGLTAKDLAELEGTYSDRPRTVEVPSEIKKMRFGRNPELFQQWQKLIESESATQPQIIVLKDELIAKLEEAMHALEKADQAIFEQRGDLMFHKSHEDTLKEKLINYLKLHATEWKDSDKLAAAKNLYSVPEQQRLKLFILASQKKCYGEARMLKALAKLQLNLEEKQFLLKLSFYEEEGLTLSDSETSLLESVLEEKDMDFVVLKTAMEQDAQVLPYLRRVDLLLELMDKITEALPKNLPVIKDALHSLFDKLSEGETWTTPEKNLLKSIKQGTFLRLRSKDPETLHLLAVAQGERQLRISEQKASLYESSLPIKPQDANSPSIMIDVGKQDPGAEKAPQKSKQYIFEPSLAPIQQMNNLKGESEKLNELVVSVMRLLIKNSGHVKDLVKKIGLARRVDRLDAYQLGIMQNFDPKQFSTLEESVNCLQQERKPVKAVLWGMFTGAERRYKINTGDYSVNGVRKMLKYLDSLTQKKALEVFEINKLINETKEEISRLGSLHQKLGVGQDVIQQIDPRSYKYAQIHHIILRWQPNEFESRLQPGQEIHEGDISKSSFPP